MDMVLRHKTATEFAADEIRRRIIEQEIPPGTRVDQTALAEALGLSRIPVRQALADLSRRGFVVLQAHRSAVVAPLSRSDMEHLYAMRNYLEAWAAEEMTSQMGEDVWPVLGKMTEAMSKAAQEKDLPRYMSINRQFHFLVFAAVENPHLRRTLESLFDLTERYQWMCLSVAPSVRQSICDHLELVDALRKRDAARVHSVLARHGDKTMKWVLDNVMNSA